MKNKLPGIINKRIDFAINHYPVKDLLSTAKLVCGSDYAVYYYNNKNHHAFYHNEEAFRHALRRCVAMNAFNHREQIARKLNLFEESPLEKIGRNLSCGKRPFSKEEWDIFYNNCIKKIVDYIKNKFKYDILFTEDFYIKTLSPQINETDCKNNVIKMKKVNHYIKLLFKSDSNEYLLDAFCNANNFQKSEISKDPLVDFMCNNIPVLKMAEAIENDTVKDILDYHSLCLSKKWHLNLESKNILKNIRKELRKHNLKECILLNTHYNFNKR